MLVGRPSRNGGGVKWRRAQGDTWAALQGCPCPSETIHGCNAARAIGLAVPEAAGFSTPLVYPGPTSAHAETAGYTVCKGKRQRTWKAKGAAPCSPSEEALGSDELSPPR